MKTAKRKSIKKKGSFQTKQFIINKHISNAKWAQLRSIFLRQQRKDSNVSPSEFPSHKNTLFIIRYPNDYPIIWWFISRGITIATIHLLKIQNLFVKMLNSRQEKINYFIKAIETRYIKSRN